MTHQLEKTWHEFADQLRAFIRRRMADDAEAEDVLQDVFLKLLRQPGKAPSPEKLPGWLFRVARNAIIDRHRTRKTKVPVSDSLPGEEAERRELDGLCGAFHRMIHSLPEPYREAIVLAEIDGMSQVALAKRLGISVSGAKSRVQRGRVMLRQLLLECCRFEFDQRGGLAGCEPHRQTDCAECG